MADLIPITAVVLAAGTSSRMGDFKPLLPFNGDTMLEIVLKNILFFPFHEVMAVVGYNEDEIRGNIKIHDQRFKWVRNRHFIEGLSSSINSAANQYNEESRGMLVFLGDQPLLQKSTIQRMLQTITEERLDQTKCIAQPIYNGTPGHPVYLAPQMIPHLKTIKGDRGAKAIFHLAEKQIHIPVDDAGTIMDIDTKKDYFTQVNKVVQVDHGDGSGGFF